MHILPAGKYLGTKTESYTHNKLIFSKTTYCSSEAKDWHCHQNAFFAYFLKGSNSERRESREIVSSPGTLLYYRSMEPHCNQRYSTGCRIFHVEIDNTWFHDNDLVSKNVKADVIKDPTAKNTFAHMLQEFEIRDEFTGDSVENLLLYMWNLLSRNSQDRNCIPPWVKKFDELQNDCTDNKLTLTAVAKQLNIHPVTLSKEFPRHYHRSFGDHVRHLRVEKALKFLSKKNMPLAEVAFASGFSDTSNFIRSFRKVKGITPNQFRKLM